jgi:hypothetical protein
LKCKEAKSDNKGGILTKKKMAAAGLKNTGIEILNGIELPLVNTP